MIMSEVNTDLREAAIRLSKHRMILSARGDAIKSLASITWAFVPTEERADWQKDGAPQVTSILFSDDGMSVLVKITFPSMTLLGQWTASNAEAAKYAEITSASSLTGPVHVEAVIPLDVTP